MNNITIKRKGRKSMLGTRQYKPPPIEPITEKSFTEENDTLLQLPKPVPIEEPTKEVVTINSVKESVIENPVDKVANEKPDSSQEDEFVIKTVRKNLICSLFPADDSFEANETMLANNSFNETVLATTLLMSAKKTEDSVLTEKNNDVISTKQNDDETLQQVLDNVTLLLKKNADAIENHKQEREILIRIKENLLKNVQK